MGSDGRSELIRSRSAGSGGSRGAPQVPPRRRETTGSPSDGAAAMRTRGGDATPRTAASCLVASPAAGGETVHGSRRSGGGGTARIECGPGARRRTGSGMSGFHAARRSGGWRQRSSAISGTQTGRIGGAQHRSCNSERGSRLRWRAVRTTLASTCRWVSAPLPGAVAAADLTRDLTAGRMACSAASWWRRFDGSHKKRNTAGNSAGQVLGEALGGGQRRRGVESAGRAGRRADRGPTPDRAH